MKPAVLATALAMALTLVLHAGQDPAPPPAQGAEPTVPVFRSGADFVSLSVTVTDNKGRAVNDLKREEFMILENGRQQEIVNFRTVEEASNIGIGIGIVLDTSGTMAFGDSLNTLRLGVERLMSRIKKEDEIYVVEFAAAPALTIPWTQDRRQVLNQIRRIKTRNFTALWDAIAYALPISMAGGKKKQVLVVITDGWDDNASKTTAGRVAEAARASDVVVYGIVVQREEAMGTPRNTATFRQMTGEISRIADATGGRAIFVQGFGELESYMDRLGREVTQQYFLEYRGQGEKDGSYNKIVVGVKRPDINIQHRRGYVAD